MRKIAMILVLVLATWWPDEIHAKWNVVTAAADK